jgi:hypothetical protein
MKPRHVYLVLVVPLLAFGLVVMGFVGMRIQSYNEARSWGIEVKVRAPVYEKPIYPYGTQSPPNRVVGYLEVGSKPDVRGMGWREPWPYWEVQLQSGARGYLFAPDVEVSRK